MLPATKKFNVKLSGSGSSSLVFVHGYGCDQNMWRFVAPSFADTHCVVSYDLAGMGGSDSRAYDLDRYATLEAHADDLGAILRELNMTGAIVIGHSVGATIACLAALRYGERIKALGLVAPSPSFINDGDYIGGFDRRDIEQLLDMMEQNFFDWAQHVTPLIAGQDPGGKTSGELVRSFCRNDPTISRHFARVTFLADHREDIARVEHPALVLQCSNDALAPRGVGAWMARHMKGGELREIEATGHCPHLTEPAQTTTEINKFIARLN